MSADTQSETMSKACTKCGVVKPFSEFYKQSAKAGGFHSWCQDCCQAKQRAYRLSDDGRAGAERRRSEGRGAAATRKYRYGLTPEGLASLLADQGHACAVCSDEITLTDAHVDHDHSCCPKRRKTCGKCVRALLCKPCNLMLGYAYDQPDRLIAAAAYLISKQED
jgi:recombination endonuclease VII